MFPDVSEVKSRRVKLSLNQTELANASGVSQSLIAKIESGKIDASYSKIKTIFESLEKLEEHSSITAKQMMNSKIIFVNEKDSLQAAVKIMRKNGVSQLPVKAGSEIVGSISEKDILDKIANGWTTEQLATSSVKDLMGEAFPTINEDTPLSTVSALLDKSPAILIKKRDAFIGIISKTDLLKTI